MTNGNDSIHNSEQGVQDGLTKREYFAAMAMQGVLSYDRTRSADEIARWSVEAADALINALNETK